VRGRRRTGAGENTLVGFDPDDPEYVRGLKVLGDLVNIRAPNEPFDTDVFIRVLRRVVSRFPPSGNESLESQGGPEGELGFTTGDPNVDYAALVMRLLFIAEQRDLQTTINEILNLVQEYTADPKTDTELGRVGRG